MAPEIRFVGGSEVQLADRRRKLWLECDGEPYDFRDVHVLGTRFVMHEIALVSFVCPRCGSIHQSLLFG